MGSRLLRDTKMLLTEKVQQSHRMMMYSQLNHNRVVQKEDGLVGWHVTPVERSKPSPETSVGLDKPGGIYCVRLDYTGVALWWLSVAREEIRINRRNAGVLVLGSGLLMEDAGDNR